MIGAWEIWPSGAFCSELMYPLPITFSYLAFLAHARRSIRSLQFCSERTNPGFEASVKTVSTLLYSLLCTAPVASAAELPVSTYFCAPRLLASSPAQQGVRVLRFKNPEHVSVCGAVQLLHRWQSILPSRGPLLPLRTFLSSARSLLASGKPPACHSGEAPGCQTEQPGHRRNSGKAVCRDSLQLNPEFRRSKCSWCASVPLGRRVLTPCPAPTAGSQDKINDTPSLLQWQVQPSREPDH